MSKNNTPGARRVVPRSRGALSGIALIVLGLWGALIPFIGPYFNFSFTPDDAWHWTSARGWLEVLPGAAAFVAGFLLLTSRSRLMTLFAAWLGVAAGGWFAVGPQLQNVWHIGSPGQPAGSSNGLRALEVLALFPLLGVVIVYFAATAFGRLSVVSLRDAHAAERRETEAQAVRDREAAAATEREETAAREREAYANQQREAGAAQERDAAAARERDEAEARNRTAAVPVADTAPVADAGHRPAHDHRALGAQSGQDQAPQREAPQQQAPQQAPVQQDQAHGQQDQAYGQHAQGRQAPTDQAGDQRAYAQPVQQAYAQPVPQQSAPSQGASASGAPAQGNKPQSRLQRLLHRD